MARLLSARFFSILIVFFALSFFLASFVLPRLLGGFDINWALVSVTGALRFLVAILVGCLVSIAYSLSPRFPEYGKLLIVARTLSCCVVPVVFFCILFAFLTEKAEFSGLNFETYLTGPGFVWIIVLALVLLISLALLFFKKRIQIAVISTITLLLLIPLAFSEHSGHSTVSASVSQHVTDYQGSASDKSHHAHHSHNHSQGETHSAHDVPLDAIGASRTPAMHGGSHGAMGASLVYAISIAVLAGVIFSMLYITGLYFARIKHIKSSVQIMPQRFFSITNRLSVLSMFLLLFAFFSDAVTAMPYISSEFTPYGILSATKIALFLLLALCALYIHFFYFIKSRMTCALIVILTCEAVITGLIFLITASAVTQIPQASVSDRTPTPAELLTGQILPPRESFTNYLSIWMIDPLWLSICVVLAFFYLLGVIKLHRRGDRWPWLKTVSWLFAVLVMFYVTNGGVAVYGMYLFSAHMVMHMTLGAIVPIFLVVASPVTLLLRAVPARRDGSFGPREWILFFLNTRFIQFISLPPIAAAIFILSMFIFYFTDLLQFGIQNYLGHQVMMFHFLLSGYLFAQSILVTDPSRHRFSIPSRMLVLVLAMATHAFFGIAIMSSRYLFLPEWFGAMGRTWGSPPLVDQQMGGALAWGTTEIPTILLVTFLFFKWFKQDQREALRRDRAEDRNGDKALVAYNEYLARLQG
ncbi:cytochrome c oxidase assembly protein [Tropheryma whipplei]|uniref:cytochrome c oxidase assembly protein n=1 Tax=Tropheryma whipplei TaxID=2039 RepID=UPI0004AFBC8C|nr:cytochrome c oxidase assembly protein [Tropheryma whipplei]